jgi:hypothetical protein
MASSITFGDYLKGNLPKDLLLKKLIPIMFIVMVLSVLISNLFYPTAFDWRYMVISDLTSSTDNPDGFLVLSIGMAICGVLMIPIPGYMHKRLKILCPRTSFFGTFFYSIGILGLILVGLVYDAPGQPNRLHENLAIVAFAGLLFAIFFWGFPMIKDSFAKFNGKNQFDKKQMLLAFSLIWFAVLGAGISALYLEVVDNDWGWVGIDWIENGGPVLASFALWEWMLFVFLMTYIVLLISMTPEKIQSLKIEPENPSEEASGI